MSQLRKPLYLLLCIITGYFALSMCFIRPSADMNLKVLGGIFFVSFIGHFVSLMKDMKDN